MFLLRTRPVKQAPRKLRFIHLNLDRPPPFLLTTGLQVSVDGEGIGATSAPFIVPVGRSLSSRALRVEQASQERECRPCQMPNWMCLVDRGHRPIAGDYCEHQS